MKSFANIQLEKFTKNWENRNKFYLIYENLERVYKLSICEIECLPLAGNSLKTPTSILPSLHKAVTSKKFLNKSEVREYFSSIGH